MSRTRFTGQNYTLRPTMFEIFSACVLQIDGVWHYTYRKTSDDEPVNIRVPATQIVSTILACLQLDKLNGEVPNHPMVGVDPLTAALMYAEDVLRPKDFLSTNVTEPDEDFVTFKQVSITGRTGDIRLCVVRYMDYGVVTTDEHGNILD